MMDRQTFYPSLNNLGYINTLRFDFSRRVQAFQTWGQIWNKYVLIYWIIRTSLKRRGYSSRILSMNLVNKWKNFLVLFDQTFSAKEREVRERPIPEFVHQYKALVMNALKSLSTIRMIIVLLPVFVVNAQLYSYLQNSPSFKGNIFAKVVLMSSLGMEKVVKSLMAFVDKRAVSISAEERSELCQLYRRAIQYEVKYHLTNYSGY